MVQAKVREGSPDNSNIYCCSGSKPCTGTQGFEEAQIFCIAMQKLSYLPQCFPFENSRRAENRSFWDN